MSIKNATIEEKLKKICRIPMFLNINFYNNLCNISVDFNFFHLFPSKT